VLTPFRVQRFWVLGSGVHTADFKREELQKFFMRDSGKVGIFFYGLKIPDIMKERHMVFNGNI